MTIGIVQQATATTTGTAHTTQTATFGSTPTNGNTLVLDILVWSRAFERDVDVPAGWVERHRIWTSASCVHLVCTRVAGAAEPTAVAVTFDSASTSTLWVFEINGAYAGGATAISILTKTHAVPSITPGAGVEALLLYASSAENPYSITSHPSGYTVIDDDDSGPLRWSGWYKHVASTSGSYTGSVTYANNVTTTRIQTWFLAAAPSVVAGFTGTPLTGEDTLNVTFINTSTNDTSWAWDFGDGGTSTSENPSHNYTSPGTYTVELVATGPGGSDTETKVGYVVVSAPAEAGAGFEWDGLSFTNERVKEWTIQRGASAELTGGSQPGSMTITLINDPDDRYNPENTGGPLYGYLHDGIRVWVGINEDGTITADAAKDVYGLFAGRITDLSVIPGKGTEVAPFVEFVCEDQLGWMSRQKVTLPDSRTRSHGELRAEVLDTLAEPAPDLPAEWTTMPLSSANGLALNILDAINQANGTRHYVKPADNVADWAHYTAVRRTSGLDGTSDAALSATDDHVTGSSGWRTSADNVINQQRASVDDIVFPVPREVWMHDSLPLTVTDDVTLWAEFGDYVDGPTLETNSTGDALTATLTPFGDTAKIELSSAGTTVITGMVIRGRLVQRGSVASVVIDDAVSQAEPRGVRAGPDLTGDYLGILASAESFARHIVWRFGNPLYRPTMTVENWFPEMFDLDLFDRIAFTSSQLGVDARIFEIVGLTLHSDLAAGTTTPVVHHTATYVLQECRVQEETMWFTLDTSELDGPDELMY